MEKKVDTKMFKSISIIYPSNAIRQIQFKNPYYINPYHLAVVSVKDLCAAWKGETTMREHEIATFRTYISTRP